MIDIDGYKGFYIQKAESQDIKESNESWNIVVKIIPFTLIPDVKEYAKTDWRDQNGDDEFIPSVPVYKAYDLDVTFYCIAPHNTANGYIKSFFDYIRSGEFSLYDKYTGIGRQKVHYVSFSPKSFIRRRGQNDVVEFTLKFKVNDPLTDIILDPNANIE